MRCFDRGSSKRSSLRAQLLLSFGLSSLAALVVVVVLACTSAASAGRTVINAAQLTMKNQVVENLLLTSRLVGEEFNAHWEDLEGTAQLIVEVVRDRIVGYPTQEGWEEGRYVPFKNAFTQRQAYPLRMPPAPLDWNISKSNINATNAFEHIQERVDEPWLDILAKSSSSSDILLSTATGAYFMQGSCDPSSSGNVSRRTYYPNCTDSNNDVGTGGVVQPTSTNLGLYDASGDIVVFLKALYESQHDAIAMGVFFHNSGAGSQIVFPAFQWFGGTEHGPYESEGCDWMRNINPYTGQPFGTEEEIQRCHPKGQLVPYREYNAMERSWCQQFALNPLEVGWYGPYWQFDDAIHNTAVITVGKAVFDRMYVCQS